jgi:hypothetical protein
LCDDQSALADKLTMSQFGLLQNGPDDREYLGRYISPKLQTILEEDIDGDLNDLPVEEFIPLYRELLFMIPPSDSSHFMVLTSGKTSLGMD